MSAELLREAAAQMRERAEAATPGPWGNRRGPSEHVVRTDTGVPLANTGTRADRRHIASWHPVVAQAASSLLTNAAEAYDAHVARVLWLLECAWRERNDGEPEVERVAAWRSKAVEVADGRLAMEITLARTYLGTES